MANKYDIAKEIAQATARLLIGPINNTAEQRELIRRVRFVVWPLEDRAVLAFNPNTLTGTEVDKILGRDAAGRRFLHHLSTALGGRRVVPSNTRGVFLQIGYEPAPAKQPLRSVPLDLSQQPTPTSIPIGMTETGPMWIDLTDGDSFLVAGHRRMGKSWWLHNVIRALIHGGRVALYLWDGKAGVEFERYANVPNVTICDDVDLVKNITSLNELMTHRLEIFKAARVTSLPEYNRTHPNEYIAPITLIIDEAAEMPADAEQLLISLVRLGGAAGIHPILATQRSSADAMSTELRANLATRLSFRLPTSADSRTIFGHGGAEKLPSGQQGKGRLLIEWEGEMIEVQGFRPPVSPLSTVANAASPLHTSDAESSPAPFNADEESIIWRAISNNLRMPRDWLENECGFSEWKARQFQERLAKGGWIKKSPEHDNSYVISKKTIEYLSRRNRTSTPSPPTLSNPLQPS